MVWSIPAYQARYQAALAELEGIFGELMGLECRGFLGGGGVGNWGDGGSEFVGWGDYCVGFVVVPLVAVKVGFVGVDNGIVYAGFVVYKAIVYFQEQGGFGVPLAMLEGVSLRDLSMNQDICGLRIPPMTVFCN